MVNRSLRLGLAGTGQIVERAHLPVLSAIPHVVLSAVYDPDQVRAAQLKEKFAIPVLSTSLDELLSLDLDAILVASPNRHHAPMSIAALEAGKHVVCEKPMATTVSDASRMAAAAVRHKRALFVCAPCRFRPEVIAMHDALRAGQLGELRSISCGWQRRDGIPGIDTWFTQKAQAGGGVLMDLGFHLLDIAVWLCGDRRVMNTRCTLVHVYPNSSTASWYEPQTAISAAPPDVETGASGRVVLEGPIDLAIDVAWTSTIAEDHTYIEAVGSKGSARVETLFGFSPHGARPRHPLKIRSQGRTTDCNVVASDDLLQPFQDMWTFVINGLSHGHNFGQQLVASTATVRIIDLLYQAAASAPEINSG